MKQVFLSHSLSLSLSLSLSRLVLLRLSHLVPETVAEKRGGRQARHLCCRERRKREKQSRRPLSRFLEPRYISHIANWKSLVRSTVSRGALAIRCEPTDLAAALTNPLCIRDHPLFSPFLSFLSFFPSFFSDRPYLAYLTVSVFADSSTRCLLCFPISRLLATPTEKDSQPTRINNFVAPLISVLAFHSVYRNLVNLRDDFCDRFLIPIGRKVFCTDAQRNLAKTL